ncbi:hypothetical protein O181_102010 [Austropuccinia psidii MF-1]|uniref:Uncharacterized protein n=1 Tax=Austropuccinia psidii MF-1 TaxID=1389203 RepID=A0A9Q3PIC7_9BASI|nr:hypothetical protein [Austropuccinia psidii MF-1]
MLIVHAYRDDLAIADLGACDIVISIAQQLWNSNVQPLSISIMTPKKTCAMGQPKLKLFHALYELSGVSPASAPQQQPKLVMLADKNTRNIRLMSNLSDNEARGFPNQDAIVRTPLLLTMMEAFPSGNGRRDPKQAYGNDSGQLALDYLADEGWQWQEDIGSWAHCHHVSSPMGFKHQKQNQLNHPQQDSPIPSLPCEQAPWKPTPGPNGTQWSEDLFHEPSQPNEPPIPGLSPSSRPHEDVLTCDPDPEVALTQSMEEPFVPSPEIPPIAPENPTASSPSLPQ